MELDMNTVEAILSGESPYRSVMPGSDLPTLDLTDFRHCSDAALARLVAHIGPLDYCWLGVEDLSLGNALKLRRLEVSVLTLTNLKSLDESAAYALGRCDYLRVLNLRKASTLSLKAARGLVGMGSTEGAYSSELNISLPSMSPEVADILRHSTGRPLPPYWQLHALMPSPRPHWDSRSVPRTSPGK